MKRKIAVEPSLTPVRDLLSNKGYEVESIDFSEFSQKRNNSFDAFVITGLDDNALGIDETSTKAVVIEARGLTAEQVYKELQSRLQ